MTGSEQLSSYFQIFPPNEKAPTGTDYSYHTIWITNHLEDQRILCRLWTSKFSFSKQPSCFLGKQNFSWQSKYPIKEVNQVIPENYLFGVLKWLAEWNTHTQNIAYSRFGEGKPTPTKSYNLFALPVLFTLYPQDIA